MNSNSFFVLYLTCCCWCCLSLLLCAFSLLSTIIINDFAPGRSEVVQSVCLSVYLFVCLYVWKTTCPYFTKFLYVLAAAMAQLVFLVLWMMSCFSHNRPVQIQAWNLSHSTLFSVTCHVVPLKRSWYLISVCFCCVYYLTEILFDFSIVAHFCASTLCRKWSDTKI